MDCDRTYSLLIHTTSTLSLSYYRRRCRHRRCLPIDGAVVAVDDSGGGRGSGVWVLWFGIVRFEILRFGILRFGILRLGVLRVWGFCGLRF